MISKKMTAKEALEKLVGDYEYLMETYYHTPFEQLKENQINQTRKNVNKIKRYLNRLEKLEKALKGLKKIITIKVLKNDFPIYINNTGTLSLKFNIDKDVCHYETTDRKQMGFYFIIPAKLRKTLEVLAND